MAFPRNATYNCSQSTTNTTGAANSSQQDLHAVLYIVVTLLFYSLGIIIGIVLYLKREKQECEEDKLFDEFVALREDPFSAFRFEQVQQVVARLNYLQKQKKIKQKCIETSEGSENKSNSLPKLHHKQNEIFPAKPPVLKNCAENKIIPATENKMDSSVEAKDVFTENGEPLASVVEKLLKDKTQKEHSNNSQSGNESSGIPQTFSMQSIKDYDEEPRRSERSSLCLSEDGSTKEENEKLLTTESEHDVFDENEVQNCATNEDLARCIVTNV